MPEQTWTQLLELYGGGEFPPIMEARDWLRGGVSEREAWDNEQRADNLLWLAQELGYCDAETLDKVACLLVDRVAPVKSFNGEEVKPEGDEKKIEVGGEAETVAQKTEAGVYAASFLLSRDHVKAATFSLKAKAQEAQAAWCAAMADEKATLAEKQELQAAQARVLRMESAEQCKVVRSMIGGPK
jgi:hypothetical protein